jgi:apolipoprotein N-acyltransferase
LLVQQNTDPRKHEYLESLESLKKLTNEALERKEKKPDLVVWSEGAVNVDVRFWTREDRKDHYRGSLAETFLEYQKEKGIWLVTGTDDHRMVQDETGETIRQNFNSASFFNPLGEDVGVYHKINLVPFSEHFPYKKQLPWVADLLEKFNSSNWTQGEERTIFNHPKFKFFTPICFEDIFPDHIRRFVKRGGEVIVIISNDYWSLTPIEGMQHGVTSLFRAVENRRPLVRATASGYTVAVDSYGRIQPGAAGFYTAETVDAELELPSEKLTLYTQFGDWFPILCGLIFMGLIGFYGVRKIFGK